MESEMKTMTWHLSDPYMDLLERAGLAALYMTLRAAEEQGADLLPLRWEQGDLKPDSVTVRWEGTARTAFSKLLGWAWQVFSDVLYFPGVHRDAGFKENLHLRLAMHNGVMKTFLQHTNVQPKGEPVRQVIRLDEGQEITATYQPPIIRQSKKKQTAGSGQTPRVRQLLKPWKDLEELFDRSGELRTGLVDLPGWTVPGTAPRFTTEQSWRGSAGQAILLMLAPAAAMFQKLQGKGSNWSLVVPDIRDLEEFSEIRPQMNLDLQFMDVASLGDAALQFLSEYATHSVRRTTCVGCRVVAMGKVGYYSSQSIRKGVLDVPYVSRSVCRYQHLHRILPNTFVPYRLETGDTNGDTENGRSTKGRRRTEDRRGTGFIRLPSARGRIADNLVNDEPWYKDLFVPLPWGLAALERQRESQPGKSLERIWFTNISYQRGNLMKLIQEDDMWDSEAEKVFVEAMWQVIASLYAQEADAAQRGTRTVSERFEDLNEEIRRKLMQAKTRTLLRAALAELIAKAGRQRAVREHPAAIWRFLDHPETWKKGRDLALLALASYSREARTFNAETQETKGE